jgi:hypothetical protein
MSLGATVALAQQPINLLQWAGTAISTGNGTAGSGTPRVTIASDNTAFSVNIGTFPDNEPFNIAQMNGVAVTMGNGISGTGVQRVTLASDSTGQVTLATGSATIGALTANQSVNVAQINGVTPLMGAGNTGTGSHRVTVATDQAALTGLGIYVEDAAIADANNLSMSGSIRRDVAAASAGTSGDAATINTDALGLAWTRFLDPCSGKAKTYFPVDIVTATTTEIANAVASEFFYICAINLFSAGTNNVAIVEDDTDACATPTAGLNGGVTAAEGYNMIAQTGVAFGNGNGSIMKTGTANRYLCIITSAAVQLSGTVVYVSAP